MTRVSRTPVSIRWAILGAAWVFACRLGAPSVPAASPTSTLIPPDASEPAAGICAGPAAGETVQITINVDVPDPRCLQIYPYQTLAVRNQTGVAVTIQLGPHEVILPAGEEALLPGPVGSYLAPGVHQLSTTPYSASELVVLAEGP